MSDPKREDLHYVGRDVSGWPINIQPLTDAEFDAIVDSDPRWVRVEVFDACAEESRKRYARIVEMERRFENMTVEEFAAWIDNA